MIPHGLRRHLIAASLLLWLAPMDVWAQSAPEAALQAAFVYNFAKFTVWPADTAPRGPLKLCVIGETAIADALDSIVKGRPIDGREVAVSRTKLGELRSCHLLYLSGLDAKRTQQVLDELKGAPVLTISNRDQFAESGGIAALFVEGNKMKFAINVEAAQRAGLQISSRLLGLAKIVKDEYAHP